VAKQRLVIADDEPAILSGLVELYPWDDMGFEIVGAFNNGKQVLEFLECNKIDILLTDIRMPIIDGLEIARYAQEKGIKVVILSAYTEFEYAKTAIAFGVRDYLVKPVGYKELNETFYRLRMEHACQLLRNVDLQISDVAKLLGYTTVGNFSRAYQNFYGESPKEFRERPEYPGYYEEIVGRVKKHVDNRPDIATLETAAEEVGFSPSHLSRMFSMYSDMTFSEYLQNCRMQMAEKLLAQGKSAEDAAFCVGYDSLQFFNAALKKYRGRPK